MSYGNVVLNGVGVGKLMRKLEQRWMKGGAKQPTFYFFY